MVPQYHKVNVVGHQDEIKDRDAGHKGRYSHNVHRGLEVFVAPEQNPVAEVAECRKGGNVPVQFAAMAVSLTFCL